MSPSPVRLVHNNYKSDPDHPLPIISTKYFAQHLHQNFVRDGLQRLRSSSHLFASAHRDMANAAIVQDGYNAEDPLSTLKVATKPIPKPAPGQVVVHIKLRPINPTEFLTLRGGAIAKGGVAGSEGYGIVYEVGEGVTTFHKGQRVVPITADGSLSGNGSFQEYVCIDADFVWAVPDEISDDAAAQFVINPWTSYSLLKSLQVPRGEYMIQSAGGSTVGKQVISLARHWGIKTINVVRRAAQKAELAALGADEVLCSGDEDVVARVKEITAGKGAWGALDAVFGASTAVLTSCVRDGGQVLVYGVMGGTSATLGPMDLFRGVSVTGWSIYDKITNDAGKCRSVAAAVSPLVRDGIIPVAAVEKHDLRDFKHAMAMAEGAARSSRILLVSA